MTTIFFISGICAGAIIAWGIQRIIISNKFVKKEEMILKDDMIRQYQSGQMVAEEKMKNVQAVLDSKDKEFRENVSTLNTRLETKRVELTEAHKEISVLSEQNKYLNEKLINQKSEIDDIGKKFSAEFQNMANRIMEEKSIRFTEINQNNIKNLLEPLDRNINEFKKKVEETYDKESKQRFSLEDKIKELVSLNQIISQEANNLTRALKGEAKKQGDWGEMILENILERSGLVKGREYFVQEYLRDDNGTPYKNESGERMRPDIIIAYPGDKKIIIDSKVSLNAYDRFCSSDVKEEQAKFLNEHVRAVRNHIDSLSAKNYQDFSSSLDFVMMFFPIEPAYFLVMQNDSEIWNYAYNKRILLMSPTNLIAALKLVLDLWKRDYQNKNAMEIAERGGQLYDKFAGFVETLKGIGDNIDRAQKSYNTAMGQLNDGKGNLVWQAEKLRELGAKAKKGQITNG